MGILDAINPVSWIGEAIKGVGSIIDDAFTTDEEKALAKNKLTEIENQLNAKVLEYEATIAKSQADVIIAEAKGGHWLQSNWRPALMGVFGVIIANNYIIAPYLSAMFDWSVVLKIPTDLWDLLKLGVGGYIGGRSLEKGVALWKGKSQ